MRKHRAAKFAEYISTYAILNYIGLHDTVVFEKRNTGAGLGLYVRDACDAGTTLLVVPSRCVCSNSVLNAIGTPLPLPASFSQSKNAREAERWRELDGGLMTFLTGSRCAAEWVELCWRMSLEQHRSYSPLWGWLNALPPLSELQELLTEAESKCRRQDAALLPHCRKSQEKIKSELAVAYSLLLPCTLTAPPPTFLWAGLVLLSRGMLVPRAWRREAGDPLRDAEGEVELGVVPYADMINGEDASGRQANATIEVSFTAEELPDWYAQWVREEAGRRSSALCYVSHILRHHYFFCVTLQQPLLPAQEVVMPYFQPLVSMPSGSEDQNQTLSRLLKYFY